MRKYAFIHSKNEVKKIMIYETEREVYLFTYECTEDLPSTKDYWFETLVEAEEYCNEIFEDLEWIQIEDPKQDDHHDLIAP